jgi:group I intron endonuclease
MKLAIIYKITNEQNRTVYVGSTSQTLEERWQQHIKCAFKEKRTSPFYDDMRNQDINNFTMEKLDTCFEKHRFILEEYWWNKLYDIGIPMYDIKRGAHHSPNTIQRMAQIRLQNSDIYSTEAYRAKLREASRGERNGNYNKKDEDALNGRLVLALNDKNEIIHKFVSVKMALKFLGLKGHKSLLDACRTGERYKGYYWKKEWTDR